MIGFLDLREEALTEWPLDLCLGALLQKPLHCG